MSGPGTDTFFMIKEVAQNGVDPTAYTVFTDYLLEAIQPIGPRVAQSTYTPILTEATRYLYLVIAIYIFLIVTVIILLLWAAGKIRWYAALGVVVIMLTVAVIYLGFVSLYGSNEIANEANTLGNEASQLLVYSFSSVWRDVLYAATYG